MSNKEILFLHFSTLSYLNPTISLFIKAIELYEKVFNVKINSKKSSYIELTQLESTIFSPYITPGAMSKNFIFLQISSFQSKVSLYQALNHPVSFWTASSVTLLITSLALSLFMFYVFYFLLLNSTF